MQAAQQTEEAAQPAVAEAPSQEEAFPDDPPMPTLGSMSLGQSVSSGIELGGNAAQ